MKWKGNISILTFIISLLPFYGYLGAYFYETGYLATFGIPPYLAQISLNTIILSTVYFTFSIAIFVVVFYMTKQWRARVKNSIFLFPILLIVIVSTILSLIIILLLPQIIYLIPYIWLLTIPIVIVSEFVTPIVKYRSIKNYKENILRHRLDTINKKKNDEVTFSKNTTFNIALLLIVCSLGTGLISNIFGNMSASTSKNFYAFNHGKESFALIRNYTNEKIAIKYHHNKIQFGEIFIFNTQELRLSRIELAVPKDDKNSKYLMFN